jgi:hypothetical protein
MTDTPPDWVLLEAAKRCGWEGIYTLNQLQHSYITHEIYSPLCDMILKHEQPPVDPKLLCAREAHRRWVADGYKADFAVLAITLWEEEFGK